jgi:hypothetical protein
MLLFTPLLSFAQLKYERESRLSEQKVPPTAREFLDLVSKHSIRWYEEEAYGNRHTVEAKFKYKGQRYSVEFDSLGQLEDIEIRIPKLPKVVMDQLSKTLNTKFRIQKIQQQYSGNIKQFSALFERDISMLQVRYELVIKLKENGKWHLYEILINEDGDVERKDKIILRNTDQLEF